MRTARAWGLAIGVWALVLGAAQLANAQGGKERLPEVISVGGDRQIKLWDSMGKLKRTLGSHDDTVMGAALATVGFQQILATVSADGRLKIWDVMAGRALHTLDAHSGRALAVAISPDGKWIATGGSDNRLRVWDRESGKSVCDLDSAHTDTIRAVQFVDNGRKLLSASADRTIRVWRIEMDRGNLTQLRYESNILAHDVGTSNLALSPMGRGFASVGGDGFLKTWSLDSGVLDKRLKTSDRNALCVAYSPDGRALATGDEEGRLRLWDAMKGNALPFAANQERGAIYTLAFSADNNVLVTGGEDKALHYWNVGTGKEMARTAAHDGAIRALLILP